MGRVVDTYGLINISAISHQRAIESMDFDIYGSAIQGARNYQEDHFEICFEELGQSKSLLVVLCDGMGGHSGGARASSIATKTFIDAFVASEEVEPRTALNGALHSAHLALQEEVDQGGAPPDMGTTLVAVYINDNNLHWVSVGDSHLYLYRRGEIRKLNVDHSMAAVLDELAEIGRITKEEAASDPQRNALRSCLSSDEIAMTDIQSRPDYLKPGDKLILASDGMDTLDPETMVKIVARYKWTSSEKIVAKLLAAVSAVRKSNQDNATAIIISTKRKYWLF